MKALKALLSARDEAQQQRSQFEALTNDVFDQLCELPQFIPTRDGSIHKELTGRVSTIFHGLNGCTVKLFGGVLLLTWNYDTVASQQQLLGTESAVRRYLELARREAKLLFPDLDTKPASETAT